MSNLQEVSAPALAAPPPQVLVKISRKPAVTLPPSPSLEKEAEKPAMMPISPPPMTREAMGKIIIDQLPAIKDHQEHLKNFLSSLSSGGDVSFQGIETSKQLLADMKVAKEGIEKIRKALIARAAARLKETI